MAAKWEFTYVDLYLGSDKQPDAVGVAMNQIAEYGQAGWEPVGEVGFMYRLPMKVPGAETIRRVLMFKRPV